MKMTSRWILPFAFCAGLTFGACNGLDTKKYVVRGKADGKIAFESLDSLHSRHVMHFDDKLYRSRVLYTSIRIGDTLEMIYGPDSAEHEMSEWYKSQYGQTERLTRINGEFPRAVMCERLNLHQRDSIAKTNIKAR